MQRMKKLFDGKSEQKPPGSIVQPDQSVDVQAGAAVIPGTALFCTQLFTGGKFRGINAKHIECAAQPCGSLLFGQKRRNGHNGGSSTVDGKHPKGGCSFEGIIASFQRIHGRKADLGKQTDQTAQGKILQEPLQMFLFHMMFDGIGVMMRIHNTSLCEKKNSM